LEGRLTFEADSDEVECDLDQVVAAAAEADRERRKHETERGKAVAELEELPKSPTDPLAGLARTQLRSLISLLDLFEKRHLEQPGQSLSATVLDQESIEPQADRPNQEVLEGRRLPLMLKSDESEFELGQIVEFRGETKHADPWERGKISRADGRHLEIELFSPSSFPADESVEVRLYLRFDRKSHQIALRRFLEERRTAIGRPWFGWWRHQRICPRRRVSLRRNGSTRS
jgi:hypothetical protein